MADKYTIHIDTDKAQEIHTWLNLIALFVTCNEALKLIQILGLLICKYEITRYRDQIRGFKRRQLRIISV